MVWVKNAQLKMHNIKKFTTTWEAIISLSYFEREEAATAPAAAAPATISVFVATVAATKPGKIRKVTVYQMRAGASTQGGVEAVASNLS